MNDAILSELASLCSSLNIDSSLPDASSHPETFLFPRTARFLRPDSDYDSEYWLNSSDNNHAVAERYSKRIALIEKEGWSSEARQHPLSKLLKHQSELRPGEPKWMRICAPMVRYSKLPFRELIRGYGVDLAYTPMILADVFKHSQISRETDLTTNPKDDPVIVQFGAPTAKDFADAAELVAPFANGVDLNCGCPQRWALSEGIGASLMENPELVRDMVRQAKARTSAVQMVGGFTNNFPISIKIRVHPDLKKTVEFVKRAESVGVDWITVHGRTKKQKNSEPVNLDAIKIAKESVDVPVFANGDIFTLDDAKNCVENTNVDGVMAARGLLENPALFMGYNRTPLSCVREYTKLAMGYGGTHFIAHHHLMYMLENSLSRTERRLFN
ncbi:hypothetical protein HK096_003110, partial [Nowakowskiella sp. JEL0078]